MTEDKIALALKEMAKLREELKDIKKDIKRCEKIEDPRYEELKKALKDLKMQVKDIEEGFKSELAEDNEYNELRELKIKKEEDLAHAMERFFKSIAELPRRAFQMNFDTEHGMMRMQVEPDMRVFVNGKEEKPRLG